MAAALATDPATLAAHSYTVNGTDNDRNGPAVTHKYTVVEVRAPVVLDVVASPNPVEINVPITLTALIDDTG